MATRFDDASDDEQRTAGRTIILRQLSITDRSRQQLIDAQLKRGIRREIAEEMVEHYEETGLVDDTQFAVHFVEKRMAERPLSKSELARQLMNKGVSDRAISAALESVDASDEWDAALAIATKKVSQSGGLDPEVVERRVWGMLQRRGYSIDVCRRAVDVALGRSSADSESAPDHDEPVSNRSEPEDVANVRQLPLEDQVTRLRRSVEQLTEPDGAGEEATVVRMDAYRQSRV